MTSTKRKAKYSGPEVVDNERWGDPESITVASRRIQKADIPELIRRLQEHAPKPEYEVTHRGNITSYVPVQPKPQRKRKQRKARK